MFLYHYFTCQDAPYVTRLKMRRSPDVMIFCYCHEDEVHEWTKIKLDWRDAEKISSTVFLLYPAVSKQAYVNVTDIFISPKLDCYKDRMDIYNKHLS